MAVVAMRKPQRDLIDLPTAADRLGVSVRYVRRLVAERRIPYFKLGHLLRFDTAEIDGWLEQAKVGEIGSATTRTRRR
jgi:excisionase family DNA binding protein